MWEESFRITTKEEITLFRGKKYQQSAKLIDRSVQYDPAEALDLVVKGASAKFDETVELHIKLGVDSRHADQQVRGAIVLPNGENIPTFDAYLKLVASKPDTRLILEMKSLSDLKREDLAAEKIVKALRKYNLLDRTDIIAFSINACLAFKKLMPDGRIFYLNGDLAPRSIKKLGLTGIDYSMSVLRKNPKWVEQAHKEGLEVNVWTVDTEEDMRYFIDLGVDYITTDYPERLQALLK